MSGNFFSREQNWFFIAFGIIALTGGVKAVMTRTGRTRSKGGHVTHFSGKEAVVRGWIGIVVGAAALVFGGLNLI